MSNKLQADYIFEVSWEVCNKVGGIHTVVSTKALTLVNDYKDKLILIGPDVWKESEQHPEFIEDNRLFKSWRDAAQKEGLRIKTGRWKIKGNPVVILVDFSTLIPYKDKIFSEFWEKYELDSLTGQWDYVEPVLFGYAAGKIIESFYNFYLLFRDNVIAQFHEWMTGSGILYLKDKQPRIGTVFTTHATVAGRCIAGNGLPLYGQMESFDRNEIARNFNVIAKQSIEEISASTADCFTTVSEITSNECTQFLNKKVDIITPNGFEDSFVPDSSMFDQKRSEARKKFFDVAESVLNQKLDENSIIVATSGRYEFKNKGIDVYIDALGNLNKSSELKNDILAFILVPAGHYGPKKDILRNIEHRDFANPFTHTYLTHELHNSDGDSVLKRIHENQLFNQPSDKVKIIFVPSYLNGDDGIFNIPYYDLLIGIDVTVFPSYYEPWGYTPLESIAFHIPTVTTTLAGFGLWIKTHNENNACVTVIQRDDVNENDVANGITDYLKKFSSMSDKEKSEVRQNALQISKTVLWKSLVKYYRDAYSIALEKSTKKTSVTKEEPAHHEVSQLPVYNVVTEHPTWKKIFIKPVTPPLLKELFELSSNLWWSWDVEATELFESIAPIHWKEMDYNPITLLNGLSYEQLHKLEKDNVFINKLKSVHQRFNDYMNDKPLEDDVKIAYFSMEFGLHASLKIYSGGLGILAGDYLKQASDSNYNMVGIGLLYRLGYFTQRISLTGQQEILNERQAFSLLPIYPVRDEQGAWKKISINFPGRTVYAKIWYVNVGKVKLYLLDTDTDENLEEDKYITHQLYGGNNENRLKQELLLGVGGVRAIVELGIKPDVFHINEGHAAFLTLERLRNFIQVKKLTFSEASAIIRNSTLFTTHTPVPAGHDRFSEDLLRTYIPHYADKLRISWSELINLGKTIPNDPTENFSMSNLAIRLCSEVNGVSRLHGKVSRDMFKSLWPGYLTDELHISYVTNGVHYPTWVSKKWRKLYEENLGTDMIEKSADHSYWGKIYDVPDKEIWDIKQSQRKELITFVKRTIETDWAQKQEDPKKIFDVIEKLNPDTLTIGFARRFATYKRAHLLFKNLNRLAELVNDPKRPVQFLFAGKAHPNDVEGQNFIKMIMEISKRKEFLGKIIFLEGYEIELAKKLVQGVDIWLNTPTRPLEASGTSGQKVIINGGLNFSVLDGWWCEGYKPDAGWFLKEESTYDDHRLQDELDAETIYSILENKIIPVYYKRNKSGLPLEWVKYIKNSIALIAPDFNTKRMIDDYYNQFYKHLSKRHKKLCVNDYELTKEISLWKRKMIRNWNDIQIIDVNTNDIFDNPIALGDVFEAEVVLNLNHISKNDIRVELLFVKHIPENHLDPIKIILDKELEIKNENGSHITYGCHIKTNFPGVYSYVFRISPKNENLPNRMDFDLVKWV